MEAASPKKRRKPAASTQAKASKGTIKKKAQRSSEEDSSDVPLVKKKAAKKAPEKKRAKTSARAMSTSSQSDGNITPQEDMERSLAIASAAEGAIDLSSVRSRSPSPTATPPRPTAHSTPNSLGSLDARLESIGFETSPTRQPSIRSAAASSMPKKAVVYMELSD